VMESKIRNNWLNNLPITQRIINTTTHRNTGTSPAKLLFGNRLDLERGLFLPLYKSTNSTDLQLQEQHQQSLSKWVQEMSEQHEIIISKAQQIQESIDNANKLKRYPKNLVTEFPINSFVLVSYPETGYGRNKPTRFDPNWRGPMRVIEHKGSEYTLLNLVNKQQMKVHISLLKPFVYDPAKVDPLEIAMYDTQEYYIEMILEHRGNIKKLSSLEFLVKWKGYGLEHNSWEPWSTLRNTEQLHDYLYNNNLRKLIPKTYIDETTTRNQR